MCYAMQSILYIEKNNQEKGICAHIFDVRALDVKQRINFFALTPKDIER